MAAAGVAAGVFVVVEAGVVAVVWATRTEPMRRTVTNPKLLPTRGFCIGPSSFLARHWKFPPASCLALTDRELPENYHRNPSRCSVVKVEKNYVIRLGKLLAAGSANLPRDGVGEGEPLHSISNSRSPPSTDWPATTCTVFTTPGRSAWISFCIFIASSTTKPWPAATCVPGSTRIETTRPGM